MNRPRSQREARPEAEKPATAVPGGPGRRRSALLVDAIGALPLFGFEGPARVSRLLHRPRHETAYRVCLPSKSSHELRQCGSAGPLHHGDRLVGLATLARDLGLVFACWRLLRAGGLLGRGGRRRRDVGGLCAHVGYGFVERGSMVRGFDWRHTRLLRWAASGGLGIGLLVRCDQRGLADGRRGYAFRIGRGLWRLSGGCILSRGFRLRGSSDRPSEPLDSLPNALRGSLAIFELRHGFDAWQAVPNVKQPLVVGADQVGKLYFGREDSCAGIASRLAISVGGDVVFRVDRKVFHRLCPFAVITAVTIHSSLRLGTQARQFCGNRFEDKGVTISKCQFGSVRGGSPSCWLEKGSPAIGHEEIITAYGEHHYEADSRRRSAVKGLAMTKLMSAKIKQTRFRAACRKASQQAVGRTLGTQMPPRCSSGALL